MDFFIRNIGLLTKPPNNLQVETDRLKTIRSEYQYKELIKGRSYYTQVTRVTLCHY